MKRMKKLSSLILILSLVVSCFMPMDVNAAAKKKTYAKKSYKQTKAAYEICEDITTIIYEAYTFGTENRKKIISPLSYGDISNLAYYSTEEGTLLLLDEYAEIVNMTVPELIDDINYYVYDYNYDEEHDDLLIDLLCSPEKCIFLSMAIEDDKGTLDDLDIHTDNGKKFLKKTKKSKYYKPLNNYYNTVTKYEKYIADFVDTGYLITSPEAFYKKCTTYERNIKKQNKKVKKKLKK